MSDGHSHAHNGTAARAQKGRLTIVLAITLAVLDHHQWQCSPVGARRGRRRGLGPDTAPEILERLAECLTGHFDLEPSTFQLERETHADHEAVLHL